MKKLLITLLLGSLAGCTPLLNISIINGGDESKQSIKGESDQAPSTKGSAAVGVGQAPVVTGGAVK